MSWQVAQNKLFAFHCANRSDEPSIFFSNLSQRHKFACEKLIFHQANVIRFANIVPAQGTKVPESLQVLERHGD